jgi:RNA polymerase sigma-54 factor
MSMKPTLQVRLSQHLALTPQLQQSIRLLQLSTLELQQEVEQMLEQNPFLEPDEDFGSYDPAQERAASEAGSALERSERDSTDGSEASEGEAVSEIRAEEFGTTEREDWSNGTENEDFDGIRETPHSSEGDDDGEAEARGAISETLQQHLHAQVSGMRLSGDDEAALHALIDSLDADGYLHDTLDDIAERLLWLEQSGHDADDPAPDAARSAERLEDLRDRLQVALRWLQSLEPVGVGARSLPECLVLQLRQLPRTPQRQLAIRICEQHLEALARRDLRRLAALTGANEELLRRAQALIVTLEPKPGRPFADAESNVVVPDVVVTRSGRSLKVALNPDVLPKLRINSLYAQAIKGQRNGSSAGLSARLQEARWFVKNVQQRFDTILRVSRAIVERQKSFFTHGAIAMRPLVLREIADELGLHESTISRVTTAKYMSTPNGTFELKYFFGSSLNTEAGGAASSTAVRALIQQFVSAEDTLKPLSDNQLADMLAEQGIQVARRTVAKYREALKIAPANLRRAL